MRKTGLGDRGTAAVLVLCANVLWIPSLMAQRSDPIRVGDAWKYFKGRDDPPAARQQGHDRQ